MHTFEEVLCRFDRYIWYMAHKYGRSIKHVDIQDLYQEGVLKLYEIYSSAQYVGRTPDELDRIFKGSLANMLRDLYGQGRRQPNLLYVDVFENDACGYEPVLDIFVDHYREHFRRCLSPDAQQLLERLLEPTPAVYRLYNIHVMRLNHLRAQGRNIRIPQQITYEIVGQSLGFTLAKTKFLIKRIRREWRAAYQQPTGKRKLNAATS